jgi:hypothetical protein
MVNSVQALEEVQQQSCLDRSRGDQEEVWVKMWKSRMDHSTRRLPGLLDIMKVKRLIICPSLVTISPSLNHPSGKIGTFPKSLPTDHYLKMRKIKDPDSTHYERH